MTTLAPRELLGRFFMRETQRLGRLAQRQQLAASTSTTTTTPTSTDASPSSSSSSSASSPTSSPTASATGLQWTSTTNPFRAQKHPGSHRHTRPLYSLRRQKQLVRALEQVQASDPSTSKEWALPPSLAGRATNTRTRPTVSSSSSRERQDGSKESTRRLLEQATKSGPYKGRKTAFKGHKWEREAESVKADRAEKLRTMPARIAEFQRAKAAAKASIKPGMPF